jgi:hypothetical protein
MSVSEPATFSFATLMQVRASQVGGTLWKCTSADETLPYAPAPLSVALIVFASLPDCLQCSEASSNPFASCAGPDDQPIVPWAAIM